MLTVYKEYIRFTAESNHSTETKELKMRKNLKEDLTTLSFVLLFVCVLFGIASYMSLSLERSIREYKKEKYPSLVQVQVGLGKTHTILQGEILLLPKTLECFEEYKQYLAITFLSVRAEEFIKTYGEKAVVIWGFDPNTNTYTAAYLANNPKDGSKYVKLQEFVSEIKYDPWDRSPKNVPRMNVFTLENETNFVLLCEPKTNKKRKLWVSCEARAYALAFYIFTSNEIGQWSLPNMSSCICAFTIFFSRDLDV